ncbi:MAG: NUDIX domain-containing protein [Geminicoccaceae bacterium]
MTRTKVALASVILRHRMLARWAHRQLPKKQLASGVLLFDQAGSLLLVKPSYRDDWLIPGGLVEKNESPWTAAKRETLEEIGLTLDHLRFLGVDWRSTDDEYDDSLHFLFHGGTLSADQQASIRCDGIEIVDFKFADREEAQALLDPFIGRRIIPCWRRDLDRPLVLNRGEPDPDII